MNEDRFSLEFNLFVETEVPRDELIVSRTNLQGVITFARGLLTVAIWIGLFSWIWIPIVIIWRRRSKKSRDSI